MLVLAGGAFALGLIAGGSEGESRAATGFAEAWEAQDFEAMHSQLAPRASTEFPLEEFTDRYVDVQSTATALRVATGEPQGVDSDSGESALFEAVVETRAFGEVRGQVELALDENGMVEWEPHMAFPGLQPGERLDRITRAPERAALLARDGTSLAEGPDAARSSPLGPAALAIAGSMGSPSRKQQRELYALGFPEGNLTGISGLELGFNERLAGQPGGQLLAVGENETDLSQGRVLGSAEPVRGKPVKTTIDPELQVVTVEALGSIYGGVAVLDARDGEVLAVAGLAFSAPQPPGSTFKMITATAALDAGVTDPSEEFPVEVSNSLIGREIANAHDAACGGTFVQAFADSCNTVFAPLGVEVGAERLVETAEAFGFNSPPSLAVTEALEKLDPPASTIPNPIDGDVAVGESAIGQGQVLATPLQMASVAQAIANDGVRMPTPIVKTKELRPDAEPVKVTSPRTAGTMTDLMVEVVRSGTGIAAQVPGIEIAGKTGTAELGPAALAPGDELAPGEEPPMQEDAWFAAFAPASKPTLAVGVMVVNALGGGGTVAAPIAQRILAAAFG